MFEALNNRSEQRMMKGELREINGEVTWSFNICGKASLKKGTTVSKGISLSHNFSNLF